MTKLFLVLAILLYSTMAAADTCKEETKSEEKEEVNLPSIKTGFLIDLDPAARDGFFYFGLELYEKKFEKTRMSLDIGVASGRIVSGLGLGIWYNGSVGPFVWAGYNISENAPAWGIGINVFKL